MDKDLWFRFLLGGTAVMLSYLISVVSPWRILAGIFAAFPAVMITAVIMVGIKSGSKKAAYIANGSVFGMIGGVVCVITVLLGLQISGNWLFSICIGIFSWLISSVAISYIRFNPKHITVKRK
ncbi:MULTISPECIES: DUF3147 family protein [Bacillus]|uniref:DUF3147 family protein n=1 Tax=Bacillus TaxID=1386 RepID=UPI0002D5386C|nr:MULTISPECIES: DUF3147 family protein [Bacillus]